MYRICINSAGVFLFVFLSGCTSMYQPTPDQLDLEKDSVISVTAVLSQTFIRGKKSDYRICSQPMPDAAFDQSEGGNVSFSMPGMGTEEVGESEGSNEVEMAGRTPAVLMAREMFYRACEFSTNFDLSSDQASEIYLKTLETISKGWQVEEGNTKITVGNTIANTSGVTIQDTLSESLTNTNTNTTSTATGETNDAPDSTTSVTSDDNGGDDDW